MLLAKSRCWFAACAIGLAFGCGVPRDDVRGAPPIGAVVSVASLKSQPANATLAVRGTMVEK